MAFEEERDVVILIRAEEGRLSSRCPGFSEETGMTTRPVDDLRSEFLGLDDFFFISVLFYISGPLYYC